MCLNENEDSNLGCGCRVGSCLIIIILICVIVLLYSVLQTLITPFAVNVILGIFIGTLIGIIFM